MAEANSGVNSKEGTVERGSAESRHRCDEDAERGRREETWERLRGTSAELERQEEREEEEAREDELGEGGEATLPASVTVAEKSVLAVFMALVMVEEAAASKSRARATKRARLNWKKHASKSVKEKTFRRIWRSSDLSTSSCNVLRPALERNPKLAEGASGDGLKKDIPDRVLLGFETLVASGLGGGRDKSVTFEGERYLCGDLMDAITERSGASGGTDRAFVQNLVEENTRKTPGCFPRLMNILALDEVRTAFILSEQQAASGELDTGAIGKKQSVWVDIRDKFVGTDEQISFKLSDDAHFLHIEPGVCRQPHITARKLLNMYNKTRKLLNDSMKSFKLSGMGAPFWNFCGDNTDVFYMYEVCELHPELLEFSRVLLPFTAMAEDGFEGAESSHPPGMNSADDDDGVNDGNIGEVRGSVAKKETKTKRAEKRRRKIAKDNFRACLPIIRSELLPGLADGSGTGGSGAGDDLSAERRQAGLEFERSRAESMKIEVRDKRREEYKSICSQLREEKRATEPDAIFIALLELDCANAMKAMQSTA